ncbi:hypothetical protein GCM10027447_12190 [Glycomyces halotolerans]
MRDLIIVAGCIAMIWLTCTPLGRYYLRRIAVGLALAAVAVGAAVELDL